MKTPTKTSKTEALSPVAIDITKPPTANLATEDTPQVVTRYVTNLTGDVTRTEPKTMVQKTRLAHNLTSALEHANLIKVMSELPSGDYLLRLFTGAIESELELLFHGPKEELPQQVADLTEVVKVTAETLSRFQMVVGAFHQTPLVDTLRKLAGNPELFNKIAQLPLPQQTAPVQYAQPQQAVQTTALSSPPNANRPTTNPYITNADISGSTVSFDPYSNF